jgi:hypothetical protein
VAAELGLRYTAYMLTNRGVLVEMLSEFFFFFFFFVFFYFFHTNKNARVYT